MAQEGYTVGVHTVAVRILLDPADRVFHVSGGILTERRLPELEGCGVSCANCVAS